MSFTPEQLNRLFLEYCIRYTSYDLISPRHCHTEALQLKITRNILDNSGIILEMLGIHSVFLVQCYLVVYS